MSEATAGLMRMVLDANPNFRGETYPSEGEPGDAEAGYWDAIVGPGKAVDTTVDVVAHPGDDRALCPEGSARCKKYRCCCIQQRLKLDPHKSNLAWLASHLEKSRAPR